MAFAFALAARGIHAEEFLFREDRLRSYELQRGEKDVRSEWGLRAVPLSGGQAVWFTSRILLRTTDESRIAETIRNCGLHLIENRGRNTMLLEAKGPNEALRAAAKLSRMDGVVFAVPVRRNAIRRHAALSPMPNDPYYPLQYHLESVDTSTSFYPSTPDLHLRDAWGITRGSGLSVALGDDGVDLQHPDLIHQMGPSSYNFTTGTANGNHSSYLQYHGTATAGLIAAQADNRTGVVGVAPEVKLSSWVIFDGNDQPATDDQLAAMWQTDNNGSQVVSVQSHSWGNSDTDFLSISSIEAAAIQSAETTGRNGLGVVIVRSGGNNRSEDANGQWSVGDANLDAYANDPGQIAVASVIPSGNAASYSNPGACILVAAPGGDPAADIDGLVTTDPVGPNGENSYIDPTQPDSADYLTGNNGFSGTSASAPQVAGLAALALSVNSALSARDVKWLLALSSVHPNSHDPDLTKNGAGFWLTHSLGFGVPNAGVLVELALRWSNRPPAQEITVSQANLLSIPDDGFRFQMALPGNLHPVLDIPVTGTLGLQPDMPTAWLPLVDAGTVDAAPTQHLAGVGALIHRFQRPFAGSIGDVAAVGSPLAVILNDVGGSDRFIPRETDYVPIPAALASQQDSVSILAALTNEPALLGRLILRSAEYTIPFKTALLVEHVRVRLHWSHSRSADLRVTVRSPSGTTSILHRPGGTTNAVPSDWTYSSVHHLGESSLGTWTVAITDEASGVTGTVSGVDLTVIGSAITDADGDGLDDTWERSHFGSLRMGPQDDPDGDGWNNAMEQLIGSNPTVNDRPLVGDCSAQLPDYFRIHWPSVPTANYSVESAHAAAGPWEPFKVVPGRYPEAAVFFSPSEGPALFRVRSLP